MATRHISNTLSRWHKVVERVKNATAQLAAQIGEGISPVAYSNLALFKAEQPGVRQATEQALAKVALVLKLNAALGTIREALARANVEKGVSALLAEQVRLQNEKTLYENLLHSAGSARVTLADAEQVLAESAKNAGGPHYRETFHFARVNEAQAREWQDRVEAIGREQVGLADQISDVNASRLAVELDEEVLAHLGM